MSNYTTLTNVNAIKTDLVELAGTYGEFYDMYIDDVRDIETAIELYNKSDAKGLAKHVDHMDTEPREDLILAFANDLGKEFVAQHLGYEVR
jgi:hypothetical protein